MLQFIVVMFNISNRRYTGSKSQLVDWIMELSRNHCSGDSFLDLFGGTGVVAEAASEHYRNILINDFLPSNHATYQAFFGKGRFSQKKIDKYILEFNMLNASDLEPNYFSESYGDRYFSMENAKKIGYIRDFIESGKDKITKREYWILITSLMYSADKIANTVGHYDAYFRTSNNRGTLLVKSISPKEDSKFDIYCEDSNKLARRVESDIVYIDPPYNSRQYSRFYHVLDNLVSWQKPELFGVAMKPEPVNMSDYSKVSAKKAFADLIDSLNCKHIIVSYNNTYNPKSSSSKNKITLEEIVEILSKKGKTISESKSHKHFNAGNTQFDDHKEYVFITQVQ